MLDTKTKLLVNGWKRNYEIVEVHNFFQAILQHFIDSFTFTKLLVQFPFKSDTSTNCTTNNHTANFQSYSMILERIFSLVVFRV